jgi:hypothetical protein
VEQIARERTYSELEPLHPPRLRLSPLLLIAFGLLISFAVVNLGMRAVAQFTVPPPNPFPAYADIFPGQAMSAAEARGFSCFADDRNNDHDQLIQHCVLYPETGAFSRVEVIISGVIIHQSIFSLRDSILQVGDIALFLETPVIHLYDHMAYYFLSNSFVIARTVGYAEQFSLFLPVWSVSFTDIDLLT